VSERPDSTVSRSVRSTLAVVTVTALAAAVSTGVPLVPALGAGLGSIVVAALVLAVGDR
jgi:hypothetical protein